MELLRYQVISNDEREPPRSFGMAEQIGTATLIGVRSMPRSGIRRAIILDSETQEVMILLTLTESGVEVVYTKDQMLFEKEPDPRLPRAAETAQAEMF